MFLLSKFFVSVLTKNLTNVFQYIYLLALQEEQKFPEISQFFCWKNDIICWKKNQKSLFLLNQKLRFFLEF